MKLTRVQLDKLTKEASTTSDDWRTIQTSLLRALLEERAHFQKALIEIVKQAGLSTARDTATAALKGTI